MSHVGFTTYELANIASAVEFVNVSRYFHREGKLGSLDVTSLVIICPVFDAL